MRTIVDRKLRGPSAIVPFVAAALITPFVITGLFRLLPMVATALPFVGALVVALVLFMVSQPARPIAVGIAVGATAHAVSLLYLFSSLTP